MLRECPDSPVRLSHWLWERWSREVAQAVVKSRPCRPGSIYVYIHVSRYAYQVPGVGAVHCAALKAALAHLDRQNHYCPGMRALPGDSSRSTSSRSALLCLQFLVCCPGC